MLIRLPGQWPGQPVTDVSGLASNLLPMMDLPSSSAQERSTTIGTIDLVPGGLASSRRQDQTRANSSARV